MPPPIRAAVIGVGHFGQYHARKLAESEGVTLVAVVDRQAGRAAEVAQRHATEALTDYREILGRVDAVSIATPPASHHAIARDFIQHDAHVLVEKPIAETIEQAQDLIRLAGEHGRVLQVGHIERFSAVGTRIGAMIKRPLFIQTFRMGTFKPRGEAVSAVLDLMIHDLDLVLSLVASPIEWIHAMGSPVVTLADDIANARIQFANGCVADLTVSRVSPRSERKMRVFEAERCTSVDFLKRRIGVFRMGSGAGGHAPQIKLDDTVYPAIDSLAEEIASFLGAVRGAHGPRVTGEDGLRALEAALGVDRHVQEHRRRMARG
jgi:predicted dehydrogenase